MEHIPHLKQLLEWLYVVKSTMHPAESSIGVPPMVSIASTE
jgi:hypothetical protein